MSLYMHSIIVILSNHLLTHMCFPTACLTVSEAGSHPSLKDGVNQRLSCKSVSFEEAIV